MKKLIIVLTALIFTMLLSICFTACSKTVPLEAATPTPTFTMTPIIASTIVWMTFQAVSDNRIINGSASGNNMGACSNLEIGYNSGSVTRILFDFDVSAIPVTATVTNAILYFVCSTATGNLYITAYKMTKSWSEGTGDCAGSPGIDSSWDNASGSAYPWAIPGGDYDDSSPSTSTTIWGPGTYSLYLDVQDWVSNSSQNYGVLLKAANEASNYAQITDKSGGANAPWLTIFYY